MNEPADFNALEMQGGSVLCVRCGYDLANLPREGVCPECGTPIEKSYLPDLLQNRSPEYLTQLRSGLSLVLNGILVMVSVTIVSIGVAFAMISWLNTVVAIVMVACTLVILFGWWRLTTPDPGYAAPQFDRTSRRVIRVAVVVQAAASLANVGLGQLGGMTSFTPGAAPVIQPTMLAFAIVVWVASTAAMIAQFFAAMLYVRWLALRVPDQKLHDKARQFMWLGPVLYIVGFACLLLGPLIALIMYWNMLDKLRKHIRLILTIGPDSGSMVS